ncbi:MOSC domain-containing protein [Paludifilum halophilum]|uniref:MOSC domain-containing protein n=1 Tax=Paludifilum halophilum TaxID=1642702 RepID=A0A235B4H4_9BACL|nr:MOSC domain-containing protein [Paludifilum halophilum]OYD07216.1 MOSC domain-containing protein [Paludifilum halophilum]
MWKKHQAVVEGIYAAKQKKTFVTSRMDSAELKYGGIPGDLHFGLTKSAGAREPMYSRGTEIFNRRQISVVSIEECEKIAANLQIERVLPQWLGANLVIRGFPFLTRLPSGSRIIFPTGAGLVCEGENLPCTQPGNVIQEQYPEKKRMVSSFVKAAMGLRGIVCMVEKPGFIHPGDPATIVEYNPPHPAASDPGSDSG